MSYPIIYKSTETDFSTLGLGVLSDAVSALITEERNGQFYLVMKYPINGARFNELKIDRLIKADASNTLKDQRFKVERITKPAKGLVTVYAGHVSNHTEEMQLSPDVYYSGNAESALNTWRDNIIDENPFTVYSDIQTQSNGRWTIDAVENARQALGGVRGSILDSYGGEYRFDNYHIGLYGQRGNDSGALIAYGKNLIDLEQEEEIASTYTSIYPYSIYLHEDGEEELITLPELYIDSQYVENYARRKILKIDFSDEEISTEESLRNRTLRYIDENNIGLPKVNLRVKFVDLSKTLDYKHLKLVEEINLCDWVNVYFEEINITKKEKVISVTWNILLDRYDEIEIGEARPSLSRNIDATVDEKVDPVTVMLNAVQTAANGKNAIFRGLEEPVARSVRDLWYKPVGDGEVEMYRFDGEIWSLELLSTGLLKGTIDARSGDLDLINLNASNISSGSIDLSEGVRVGNGEYPVLYANADGEVQMNVDSLLINSFDPEADSVHERDLIGYLRYSNGVVEIGEEGAEVVTQFANDEWAMVRNGERVMWLEQDVINIQKAHFFEQMQVGNFSFVPRANGSMDLKQVVN